MSWYLFKDAPSIKPRGIKVDGYHTINRPKINLSWGMNQRQYRQNHHLPQQSPETLPTAPATFEHSYPAEPSKAANPNNIKVLTDTSDDEQQELIKLLKTQNDKKIQQEAIERFNKNKRGQSLKGILEDKNVQNQQKTSNRIQMNKRIRYLENSLLPNCRRDSIATILDYNLNKEMPLEQSRLSGRSSLHNKKNQSKVVFGDGYNIFTSVEEKPKELFNRLKDMYDYDEDYKKRMERNNIRLG